MVCTMYPDYYVQHSTPSTNALAEISEYGRGELHGTSACRH